MTQTTANTRFSDIVLDNANLSMAAKGVFVTIGFLGNGCAVRDLLRHCNDSDVNIQSYLGELKKAGYIVIEEGAVYIQKAPLFGVLG